ncbi:MAG: flagellar biosynthesis protein FliP [Chthoniobacter sp.]|jgi:flagellar biosynthetic protein FliP|nr:flagellar biosynthesis protein FliP [Chthoniobacter sp.]
MIALLARLSRPRWRPLLLLLLALTLLAGAAQAQGPQPSADTSITTPLFKVNVSSADAAGHNSVNSAIQIMVVMTMLTLAPSIIFLMTSFTRIVIVLGFVRNALGVQGAPSNQIIIGLSLFLTMFIMAPVWGEIQKEAYEPYMADQLAPKEALAKAAEPMKKFMLRQTRTSEVEFFLGLAGAGPTSVADLPINVIIPAFIVSELRTAFQMGLMIFIPFLVIDFLVAATLMSMGMMMMPPVVVSLPFKLLLFVLVNGWHLIISSLVQSFGV